MRKANTFRQSIATRSLLTLTLVFSLLFATASSVFAETMPASGGTLSFAGGDVTVTAPDSAQTADVTVTYAALTSATAPAGAPAGKSFGSQIFTLTSSATFKQFASVTVKYTAADKAAANGRDDNVGLYIYDVASGTWMHNASALPNVIDRTFTSSQLTLGTFALILDAPPPPPPPTPTPVPVVVVTPPDTGDFGVSTGMMLAMGMVGLFFVLGGGLMVARGRNS